MVVGLRSLGNGVQKCKENVADKLAPAQNSCIYLRTVLRWTLDKKEIDTIPSRIGRLKTLVGLLCRKNTFKLFLAMKDEIKVGFHKMGPGRDGR